MAQKTFFAVVTLIACALAFAPVDFVLVAWLSNYASPAATITANVFGIIAAAVLIFGVFNRHKGVAIVRITAGWALLNVIVSALFGLSIAGSLVGGAIVSIFLFALFVIVLIYYEDLGGSLA